MYVCMYVCMYGSSGHWPGRRCAGRVWSTAAVPGDSGRAVREALGGSIYIGDEWHWSQYYIYRYCSYHCNETTVDRVAISFTLCWFFWFKSRSNSSLELLTHIYNCWRTYLSCCFYFVCPEHYCPTADTLWSGRARVGSHPGGRLGLSTSTSCTAVESRPVAFIVCKCSSTPDPSVDCVQSHHGPHRGAFPSSVCMFARPHSHEDRRGSGQREPRHGDCCGQQSVAGRLGRHITVQKGTKSEPGDFGIGINGKKFAVHLYSSFAAA